MNDYTLQDILESQKTPIQDRASQVHEMWKNAKARAKIKGVPFDLYERDTTIPDVCPVLGMKLRSGIGARNVQDCSPTLDRIHPSKGYVQGNIQVISHRANTLKRDGTLLEMEAVVEYMRKHSN